MITQTVNLYQFRDAFRNIRPDNFSYEGLEVLFDYLEDLSDDLGETIDLDVIGLCCEYREEDIYDIADDYGIDLSDPMDNDQVFADVIAHLEAYTTVIGCFNDRIVFQAY